MSARADCDAGATELVGGTAAHVAILEYEFSSASRIWHSKQKFRKEPLYIYVIGRMCCMTHLHAILAQDSLGKPTRCLVLIEAGAIGYTAQDDRAHNYTNTR